jgi:hypothetical protein
LSSAATPERDNLAHSRAYETHALKEAVGALQEPDTHASMLSKRQSAALN